MNIDEFRVVVRARDFEATCRFYGEVMALPKVRSWQSDTGRGALYQAGSGLIEILGRPQTSGRLERDEDFDYQGPDQKLTLTILTDSAEKAYEEMIFRDQNIPGGLREVSDGSVAFQTQDPDGVRILLREPYKSKERG